MTLEKKAKVSLTDEQLAIREANRQKAAPYKERRIALGLLQKELAEKANIHKTTISFMEAGKRWPLWETRQKIRRVLEMPKEPEERIYSDEQLAVWESNRQKAAPYKERRIALGLSQKELTEKSGISNLTISYGSGKGLAAVGNTSKNPACAGNAGRTSLFHRRTECHFS